MGSITKEDLKELKTELISEMKGLLTSGSKNNLPRAVKSAVVKEILSCSDSQLKTLRKRIGSEKIGGDWYYNLDDIEKVLPKPKLTNE